MAFSATMVMTGQGKGTPPTPTPTPYDLHPTLHPTPYTLHLTPYTIHPGHERLPCEFWAGDRKNMAFSATMVMTGQGKGTPPTLHSRP